MTSLLPRENLVRALAAPPELVRDDNDPGGMPVMRGHFAVWDTPTEINSAYEGHFIERFAAGSMNKTIAEGRDKMRVLFQHGRDGYIGDKPLGPISRLEADEKGAYYEVPMLDTEYNRSHLIPGLDAGLYGASFRFQVISEEVVKKPPASEHNPRGLPERTVTEARVREFGPVTFPAYPTATAGLRSLTDEFLLGRLLDDPERLGALLEQEKQARQSFGSAASSPFVVTFSNTSTTSMGPEPPEATTPENGEPEPSEATTRDEPGTQTTATKAPSRFQTREEWLQWISRI